MPYNRRTAPSSLHRSSPSTCSSGSGSSIDLQQPSSSNLADAVTERALVPRPAKLRSSPAAGMNKRSIHSRPLQLSVDASLWQAAAAAAAGDSRGASTGVAGGNAVSSSANSLTGSQQGLLSFPVDDLEQEDCGLGSLGNHHPQPGSPRSWPMQDDDADAPAAAAGAGTSRAALRASMDTGSGGSSSSRRRRRSAGVYASTQAAVQAVAAGAVAVLHQLAVPGGGLLDQEGACHSPIATGARADTDICYDTPTDISAVLGKPVHCSVSPPTITVAAAGPWSTGVFTMLRCAVLCLCRLVDRQQLGGRRAAQQLLLLGVLQRGAAAQPEGMPGSTAQHTGEQGGPWGRACTACFGRYRAGLGCDWTTPTP